MDILDIKRKLEELRDSLLTSDNPAISLSKGDHRIPACKGCADWVWEAEGEDATKAKMSIPKMSGEHRKTALDILAQQTSNRTNPHTGEREYLLHRGGSSIGTREYKPTDRTSWTPVAKYAHRQAYYEDTPGKVGSAWVPESQLHSGLAHYTYTNPQTQKTADAEQEWLVNHDKPITFHSIQNAVKPSTIK